MKTLGGSRREAAEAKRQNRAATQPRAFSRYPDLPVFVGEATKSPLGGSQRVYSAEMFMDQALIEKAREGDSRAIRALYDAHADRVYAVVRRLAGDDAEAEDWAQEAWLRVFRALPHFRGEARLGTWIHRIAINSALHGRRRERLRLGSMTSLNGASEPVARVDRPLLRLGLAEAVDRLPDGMRRVLVLHDVEGYTHEEIADLLGVTTGTCKSQLFKARAKLRQMLEPAAHRYEGEEVCST